MKYLIPLILLSTILSACSSTGNSKIEIPGATPSKQVLENPGVIVDTGVSATSNTPLHTPLR